MLRSIEIKPWFLRFVLYEHFSSSLSLARTLWVTEVDEPHNRALLCWGTEVKCGKYAGSRKCSTKNMLGHGRPPRLAWRAALVAPSPAGLLGCCALPCPSLISIHTPPFSRGRTFVLGLAKRLASSRRSSLPRSPLSPSPSLSLSLFSLSLSVATAGSAALTPWGHSSWGRRIQFKFGMLNLTTLRLD